MSYEFLIPQELLESADAGQKAHYKKLLKAKKARLSPLDYALYDAETKVGKNKAKDYRHTRFLNEVFMALVENRLYKEGPGPDSIVIDITEDEPYGRRVHPETGEPVIKKLMTSMPPRIGKSFFFGRYVPAWFVTTRPTETIMYMSYAASLANEFSQSSRDTIKEHPELGVSIDPNNASVPEWKLQDYGGGFIARGFGGIPTGRGGNLLIDDPFQDGAEAMSETRRDFIWNQYVSSLLTRVERDCWIVVNGTRWHEDDLHGRLLAHEADEWFVINLPAIAFDEMDEEGFSVDPETKQRDALGRRPGEAICAALYPASYYRERQRADPFWYEAEYLGKPSGVSGNMFKQEHFRHYKKHIVNAETDPSTSFELFTGGDESEFVSETDCIRFGIVDLAASDKQSADYTVLGVWELDPWKRLYLRQIVRERVTGDNHEDFIKENYKKYELQVLGIEEASFGYTLIQTLIADASSSMNIWPLKADKNKTVRAIPAASLFKKGLVYIDRDADWRSKYESELKKFDKDVHDDQVDVTAYAARMRELLSTKAPPTSKSKESNGFESRMTRLADSAPEAPKDAYVICGG